MVAGGNVNFSPEILAWYREQIGLFGSERVLKSPTDTDVLCPVHGDRNPSLGVDLRQNGAGPKIVLNCRSQGCEYSEILEALGLESDDLYYRPDDKSKASGCTLEQYAASKGLPKEFLEGDEVALEDTRWWDVDAVEIPYADEEGGYVLSRYRVSLTGDRKVVSRKGDSTMPYGLHRLEEAREARYLLLVEGESDCHSAWYHGLPAIGVPGAKNWKPEWASYLDGIPQILVVVEPDGGGKELWEKILATEAFSGCVEKVVLAP